MDEVEEEDEEEDDDDLSPAEAAEVLSGLFGELRASSRGAGGGVDAAAACWAAAAAAAAATQHGKAGRQQLGCEHILAPFCSRFESSKKGISNYRNAFTMSSGLDFDYI